MTCVLLSLPSYSSETDLREYDGNNWKEMSESQRIFWVSGFMAGATNVADSWGIFTPSSSNYDDNKARLLWLSLQVDKEKITCTTENIELICDYQESLSALGVKNYGIYTVSVSQLVEGLNQFYKDFKNTQIKISDAIYVVKKQIRGASNEEIEAILQWLRGSKKDYSKRFYIDKNGRRQAAVFP
jgi:hypothetical protein